MSGKTRPANRARLVRCGCEKWRDAGWRVWCASCHKGDPYAPVVSGRSDAEGAA